jgi:glycosyltransferase involved in cell wall biosynthesis
MSQKILIIANELYPVATQTGASFSDSAMHVYFLSQFLRDEGHVVTLLTLNKANARAAQKMQDYQGISIVTLPEWQGQAFGRDAPNLYKAFEIYRWAKDQDADIIFYNDTMGYGYYLTEAKRQGYGFQNTLLVGTLLRPQEVLWDVSNTTVPDIQSYITTHIEQKSMEQSDAITTFTQDMHDVLAKKGWNYPDATYVIPPLYYSKTNTTMHASSPINELVFIGDLTTLNGYDIFSNTIKRAYTQKPDLFKDVSITFIGHGSLNRFAHENPTFLGRVTQLVMPNFTDVLGYIQVPNRLVLRTSRACAFYYDLMVLHSGAHFIGQKNGALEAFIHESDIDAVLTPLLNPAPLALKLIRALETSSITCIQPRFSLHAIHDQWKELIQDRVQCLPSAVSINTNQSENTSKPFVSVCMSHYNRPDQLIEALKSLEAQDYPTFEVLVMDDGSTTQNKEILRRDIEPFMHKHGWRLFYQDNQFMNAARNNLVPHAKGEWLMFMDDDNIAMPDEISRFMCIAQRTKADIVNSNFYIAETDKYKAEVLSLTLGDALLPSLFGQNYFGDTNIFIKKDAFINIDGWYDHYGFSFTDQYLPIAAISNDLKVVVSVEPTFIYNLVGDNHIGHSDRQIVAFQYRMIAECYAKMLPKALRNLPFLTYSLASEYMALNIENISAKEIIKHRVKKKIGFLIASLKKVFTQ